MKNFYDYTFYFKSLKKYFGFENNQNNIPYSNKIPIPQFMIREDNNNKKIEDDYYFITKNDYCY